MGVVARGFKNAFRNNVRTFSIVLILAISIAMALIMLMSLKTVQSKIESVKSSIGNYISVAPAGIRGFEGGGDLLTTDNVANIKSVANVKNVVETLSDRVTTGTDTNLTTAIDAGSFGQRQQSRNGTGTETAPPEGSGRQGVTSSGTQRSFTMPITITGTSDLSATANLNVSKFDITSGEKFDSASTENVAMIGTALATKNSLNVGSTFQAYGKDIKVVGIFDGGNAFANGGIVMPIGALQTLSSQVGAISSVSVETNSIDTVAQVQTDIKSKLGDKVDVTSQQDSSQSAVAPLENIKTISLYSLIGSLVAGAVIIFLTMIMIVRERRREIGVLKAIGASNAIIMTQFMAESLVLTLISSVVGIILGLALSNPVLKVLVTNSESSTQTANQVGRGGGAMMRFAGGIGNSAGNAIRDLHAVVGFDIILYGIGAAIIIAIIGSALPSFIIAKVRPAEVLRSE